MGYISKRKKIRRYRSKKTFTKQIMTWIVGVALLDMQFPFILAFLGKDQIAETLGGLIATEIIGIFLVYCCKSFFETREEEKVRLESQERLANISEDESEDGLEDEVLG